MRRRSLLKMGPAAFIGLAVAAKLPDAALARLQDDGTPTAEGTPEAEEGGSVEVVTLVSWYMQDESGDFLNISPLSSNQFSVASQGSDSEGLTGRADFDDPDNDDLPRITLGDHVFDAYPTIEDDPDSVFRWLYLDDEGGRPATLVLLVECTSSPTYEGYSGSATFISRAENAGGILVIALNPPAEEE